MNYLQPTPQDERDYIFGSPYEQPTLIDHDWDLTGLPTKVDLRQFTGAVENQRATGACVAKATISACEVLLSQAQQFQDLSSLFVYYNARIKLGQVTDNGSNFRNALSEATKKGVATARTWPFYEGLVNTEPSQEAYLEGANRLVTRYERLGCVGRGYWGMPLQEANRMISDAKVALASGYSVLFGIALHKQFGSLSGPAFTHNYTKETISAYHPDYYGHHAMLCVGYDDTKREFLIENSWGESWGEGGYTVMDYDAWGTNVALNDAFVIREFAGLSRYLVGRMISRSLVTQVSDTAINAAVVGIVNGHDPYPVKARKINEAARQHNVSRPVIARATGYSLETVNRYLDYLWE